MRTRVLPVAAVLLVLGGIDPAAARPPAPTLSLAVEIVRSATVLTNIDMAAGLLDAPGAQPRVVFPSPGAVDWADRNGSCCDFYDGGFIFEDVPLLSSIGDPAAFAVRFAGVISVPPGDGPNAYTFAVVSDDGFRLTVSDGTSDHIVEYRGLRGVQAGPLLPMVFPEAGGEFAIQLDYFECYGGAIVELAYAPGLLSTFDRTLFSLVEDAPPSVLIGRLAAEVTGLNLDDGIANSLDAKLASALSILEDGSDGNDGAAVNKLQAFINEVDAQEGKKILQADAQDLIAAAQHIVDLLTG